MSNAVRRDNNTGNPFANWYRSGTDLYEDMSDSIPPDTSAVGRSVGAAFAGGVMAPFKRLVEGKWYEHPPQKKLGTKSGGVSAVVPPPQKEMGKKNNKKKFVKQEIKQQVKAIAKKKFRMPATSLVRRPFKGSKFRKTFMIGKSKTRVYRPPVVYGFQRSESNMFSFRRGRKPGCLVMAGKIYLGSIRIVTDGSSNSWPVLAPQDHPINTVGNGGITVFNVMPQNEKYFGAPVNNIAILFERFEMKTKLEFKTTMTTQIQGALKLAYFDDPVFYYEQTGNEGINTDGTTHLPIFADAPTAAQLASNNTIREGSIWKNLSSSWSHKTKGDDMKFIPAYTYTNYVNPATTAAIDIRQSIQGNWVIAGVGMTNNINGTTNNNYAAGELWLTYELELCDIGSVNYPATDPTLTYERLLDPILGPGLWKDHLKSLSEKRKPFLHSARPADGKIHDRLAQLEERMQQMAPFSYEEKVPHDEKVYRQLRQIGLRGDLADMVSRDVKEPPRSVSRERKLE